MLLFSCQSSNKKIADDNITWEIPIEEAASTQVKMSDLLDDAFFIPLETKEDNLLGEIKKIKFDEDKIYLNSDNTVLACYDMDGNHVFDIDRKGRGPGEYLQISDFVVDGDSIYLLDNYLKKVHVYDKDALDYKRSIDLPFFAVEMEKSGDNLVFFPHQGTNGRQSEFDYELLIYSIKDGSITKHLPYPKEEYDLEPPPYLVTKGDSVIYTSKIRNTAFLVEGNTVEPYAHLSIEKNTDTVGEVMPYANWSDQNFFKSLSNWRETNNYTSFQYRSNIPKTAYYHKTTGKIFEYTHIKDDLPPLIFGMTRANQVYHDYFVHVEYGKEMEIIYKLKSRVTDEDLENEAVNHLYNSVKPAQKNDNPTLLFYKFK